VSLYLDASVRVALFANDPFSVAARTLLRDQEPLVLVSDFAAAEFSAVIARRTRTGELTQQEARTTLANFDRWISHAANRVETASADISEATTMLRRLDTTLRAPDAIHIAIAVRLAASLFTFDRKMALSARMLGVFLVSV